MCFNNTPYRKATSEKNLFMRVSWMNDMRRWEGNQRCHNNDF